MPSLLQETKYPAYYLVEKGQTLIRADPHSTTAFAPLIYPIQRYRCSPESCIYEGRRRYGSP